MRYLAFLSLILLSACGTTHTVPVPTPIVVPGPTQYVPVSVELLTCAPDLGPYPVKGDPVGDAYAWMPQAWAAIEKCRANMEQIKGLGR